MKFAWRDLRKRIFTWTTILIMMIIFFFSNQPGAESWALSSKVSKVVKNTAASHVVEQKVDTGVEKKHSEGGSGVISFLRKIRIRKMAHIFLYLLLGLSVSLAISPERSYSGRTLVAALICFGYACSDEIHQMFVIDRTATITDVGIDMIGVMIGITFVNMLYMVVQRIVVKKANRIGVI